MANVNFSSPGVKQIETDISQYIQNADTSVGAIVGASNKGPVSERTLITSVKQFVEIFGQPDPTVSYMHYAAIAFLNTARRLYVTRVANNPLYGGVIANVSSASSATSALSVGMTDPETINFGSYTDSLFLIAARDPGTWNNNITIKIDNINTTDSTFDIYVYQVVGTVETQVEQHTVSRQVKKDASGRNIYLEDKINIEGGSQYIYVVDNTAIASTVLPKVTSTTVPMTQGTNGSAVSDSLVNLGWDLYANKDIVQVNLLINAGYATSTVHGKMISLAEAREDCFAILDMPYSSQDATSAQTYRTSTLASTSSYAALYTPHFKINDDYSDRQLVVPPSGHIAAVFAYTDGTTAPWYAPAGPTRSAPLQGKIIKLDRDYDQGQRDLLYENGINPIVVSSGLGYEVLGNKTLQGKLSATNRINVRRLLITINTALGQGLRQFLFEPNNARVRGRVTDVVDRYMRQVQANSGVYQYQVVCDESNNTPQVIDQNRLHIDLYLQPQKSVEFIQTQAVVTRTGVSFNEIITNGGNV